MTWAQLRAAHPECVEATINGSTVTLAEESRWDSPELDTFKLKEVS